MQLAIGYFDISLTDFNFNHSFMWYNPLKKDGVRMSHVWTMDSGNDLVLKNFIDCKPYNSCPYCNQVVQTNIIAIHDTQRWTYDEVSESNVHTGYVTDILYQCSDFECDRIFLIHYESDGSSFGKPFNSKIIGLSPISKPNLVLNEEIDRISPLFYEIYKQAIQAEESGLTQICGMGYRKALEFLLKDYIIYLKNDEEFDKEKFLKKSLSNCVNQDVTNHRIKEMANRAVWIGNDETHYKRKWENKDVNDLKKIIEIVLHEMNMEIIYRGTLLDMPEGVK